MTLAGMITMYTGKSLNDDLLKAMDTSSTLSYGANGQPLYTLFTSKNTFDLSYLPGIPNTFIIPIPSVPYDKTLMNSWIYFVNSLYTEATTYLNTIDAKGAADEAAYNKLKISNNKSPDQSVAVAARAADKASAALLIRPVAQVTDIASPSKATVGGSIGPLINSVSGPPAPIYSNNSYIAFTPPPQAGPMAGGSIPLQGPRIRKTRKRGST